MIDRIRRFFFAPSLGAPLSALRIVIGLKIQHRRLAILSMISIAILTASFWMTSRYPDLDKKSTGAGVDQPSMLSHNPVFQVTESQNFVTQVFLTWLNWCDTNLNGMVFGMLLGAFFLSLFQSLTFSRRQNNFTQALMGLGLGTPLGVCVNCAAPMMVGLLGSSRVTMALAAMLASPVFNIVVVSMSFSLFPAELVVAKLSFNFLLILLVLPLFVKAAPNLDGKAKEISSDTSTSITPQFDGRNPLRQVLKNVFYVFKISLPLMLLAGLLGALVAHSGLLSVFESRSFSVPDVLLASFFGTFLPLPIGVDVIVANSFYQSGSPMWLVAALLFSLGSFSIYSYFLVGKMLSLRLSTYIFAAVMSCAILLSGVSELYLSDDKTEAVQLPQVQQAVALTVVSYDPKNTGPALERIDKGRYEGVEVETYALRERTRDKVKVVSGLSLGIMSYFPSPLIYAEPELGTARPMTNGDFNGDLWQDIVVASENHIDAYANTGGEFKRVPLPQLHERILVLALIDLDNDGDLDLLASSFFSGIFYILNNNEGWGNNNGGWGTSSWIQIPGTQGSIPSAITVADLDQNGLPDLAFAHSHAAHFLIRNKTRPLKSENVILYNHFPEFKVQKNEQWVGESLANLFTDANGDGNTDLIVANDFGMPSYLSTYKSGKLNLLPSKVPVPTTGMGVDSADIDGDQVPEQIVVGSHFMRSDWVGEPRPLTDLCQLWAEDAKSQCLELTRMFVTLEVGNKRNSNLAACDQFQNANRKKICQQVVRLMRHVGRDQMSFCEQRNLVPFLATYCRFIRDVKIGKVASPPLYKSSRSASKNALFNTGKTNGWERDRAAAFKIDETGWAWGSRFADLNNDGWQDLFVVNGFAGVEKEVSYSNLWLENIAGKVFELSEHQKDIEEKLVMNSSCLIFDIDLDGDLDVLTSGALTPFQFMVNSAAGDALLIDLVDSVGIMQAGNAIVKVVTERATYRREVKMGQGYVGFQSQRLHFGLGSGDRIKEVSVTWSDGSKNRINSGVEKNHLMVIRR